MESVRIEIHKCIPDDPNIIIDQIETNNLCNLVPGVGVTGSVTVGDDYLKFSPLDRVHFVIFDFSGSLTRLVDGNVTAFV